MVIYQRKKDSQEIPQESLLGSFLNDINDLDSGMIHEILKFTDDTTL